MLFCVNFDDVHCAAIVPGSAVEVKDRPTIRPFVACVAGSRSLFFRFHFSKHFSGRQGYLQCLGKRKKD